MSVVAAGVEGGRALHPEWAWMVVLGRCCCPPLFLLFLRRFQFRRAPRRGTISADVSTGPSHPGLGGHSATMTNVLADLYSSYAAPDPCKRNTLLS